MKTPRWMVQSKGFGIISYLANKGPSTEYRIRTETKMFHSTVQKTLTDLVRTGLVRELTRTENSGRSAKKYWLTFAGMVQLLHFLGRNPPLIDISRIRDTVITFNSLEDYPIFLWWKKLQKIFNISIFRLFVDTSWVLVENPPHFLLDHDSINPLVRTVPLGQVGGVKERWKNLPEDNLKQAFSFIFFTDTGFDYDIKRSPDPALKEYMENVLIAYKNSLEQIKSRLTEIENHWAKILGAT